MIYRARFAFVFLLLCLCSSASLAAGVTRGPYLQQGTESTVIVRWRTDSATDSVVRYGAAPGSLNQSASVGGSRTEHTVMLSNLAADTLYYYSVGDAAGAIVGDSSYRFTTAPGGLASKATRIWVIGDSGTANSSARAVRDAYKNFTGSREEDLWLMLGDNAYPDGTDSQYQAAVFDTYPEILRRAVLWSTFGNHDGHTADSATQSGPYYDIFEFPRNGEAGGLPSGTEAYYSFDYGNIHFVCLDSYESNRSPGGAMLTWLENDLAATDAEWIIAFWHHPPYTKGSHDSDTESQLIQMRSNALPILEQYGVDLVLSGHSHSYERSFLLDGHYGSSGTLTAGMMVDGGSGREDDSGPYLKPDQIGAPNAGAVYAVAGSSGKLSGGALNHPAMFISLNSLGSMVLDIEGGELDGQFIDQNGVVQDYFTLRKYADSVPPALLSAAAINASQIRVTFSETLDPLTAEDPANYTISSAVMVIGAAMESGGSTVVLDTSPLSAGSYLLTVGGVQDTAGNTIAANSQTGFDFTPTVSAAFQDDTAPTAGYSGTRDAYIRAASPTTRHGLEPTLQVDGDEPTGSGQDMAILVSWDISSLPAGAIIDSATLVWDVINVSSGGYQVFGVNRAWNESEVTWNEAAAGVAWQTSGAQGSEDRGTVSFGTLDAVSLGNLRLDLNASGVTRVQAWVDDVVANNGLLIYSASTTDGADFRAREDASAGLRPRLELEYHVDSGGGDNQPPTVPSGLVATAIASDSISLGWQASSDNVGVAFYRVYRDGSLVGSPAGTVFSDSGLTADTAYSYRVSAVDAAGNESGLSTALAVTTDPAPSQLTLAFQDGVSPDMSYQGTRDAYIRQASATTAHGAETTLQVDGDEPSGSGQDMVVLLNWDLSAIPPGALIEGVTIELDVVNPSNGNYELYALKRPWTEAQVTWSQAAAGVAWGAPGASDASDRGSTVLGSLATPAIGPYQLSLNTAGIQLVQDWVDGVTPAHGFLLANSTTTDGADMRSRENATSGGRPRLEIRYADSGGGQVIGEAGIAANNSGQWTTVSLNNVYADPVVVMGPASFAGSQPVTLRVRNVSADRFEFQLDEWDYLDGGHVTESIGYVVMESGRHVLADGTVVEAGVSGGVDHNWSSVNFSAPFSTSPIVLAQPSSDADAQAVVSRLRNSSASGFQLRLQEEEANDGLHALESVDWIAFSPGVPGMAGLVAGLTPDAVTHTPYTLNLGQSAVGIPVFLAAMQTFDGGDTAGLRYRSLDDTSAEIFVEEEQSANTEVSHTTEQVGYLSVPPGNLVSR